MIVRKYQPLDKLGNGKFGTVYKGINIKTDEHVAIKVENIRNPIPILKHETTILNYLYGRGCRNIPNVYWFGNHQNLPTLIIPLYQCSLTEIFRKDGDIRMRNIKNNIDTTDKTDDILRTLLEGLAHIHNAGIIHRDIKPDNIMYKNGEFFFIDFGFATSYKTDGGKHIEFKENNTELIGSPKYASINIHQGMEPTRRDDVISLGYVYLYMIFGELDWIRPSIHAISGNIVSPYLMKIADAKSLEKIRHLTLDSTKYENIFRYFEKCYQLKYSEEPDYLSCLPIPITNNSIRCFIGNNFI